MLFNFLKYFETNSVNSSLNVCWYSHIKVSSSELLFVGSFLITDSVLLVINPSVHIFYLFLIQSWKMCVSVNLSISSRLSSLLAYNFLK